MIRIIIILLLIPTWAFGAITLNNGKWSTSFSCSDWTQHTDGSYTTNICDGINAPNYGNGCGPLSTISATSNNSAGGGGSGFAMYVCTSVNDAGSNPQITLSQTYPELWFRWYMKIPPGLAFTGDSIDYWKSVDFDTSNFGHNSPPAVIGLYGPDQIRLSLLFPPYDNYYSNLVDKGWNVIKDGAWHYLEFHVKTDTNGSNGVWEQWIDGTKVAAFTNLSFQQTSFDSWTLNVNQSGVSTPGWVYLDDFAVSTAGYIGPYTATTGSTGHVLHSTTGVLHTADGTLHGGS